MTTRRFTWLAVVGAALTVLGATFLLAGFGPAGALTPRIAFQLLTGPSGGTYFPVGQLLAGMISNPAGVDRCGSSDACGPVGLIVSARTSDGAVANLLAVNSGDAESGLAQSDVVADAVAGRDAFAKPGRQRNVRVMASLFAEDVHLVVARKGKIASVADLRGKRVSIGADSSGTSVTARTILAAYGVAPRRVHLSHEPSDRNAQLLEQGRIDAFFFVGGHPVPLLRDLLARGHARLVPIDGKGRAKLVKANSAIRADTIPAGTYRGVPAVATVKVNALWVVNAKVPDALVYGIVRALYSSGNRDALREGPPVAAAIQIGSALDGVTAPLHPGAARYYREAGRLPKPVARTGKR